METPVHPFGSPELPEPSRLPCRSATRLTLARTTRSRSSSSIFVSTCSCAPRVFRRASLGPQGRVEYPSGVRGKARYVGYVLQSSSADRAESLGL